MIQKFQGKTFSCFSWFPCIFGLFIILKAVPVSAQSEQTPEAFTLTPSQLPQNRTKGTKTPAPHQSTTTRSLVSAGTFSDNPFDGLPQPQEDLTAEQRVEAARELAEQARADMQSLQYLEAARKFESSYRLVPRLDVLLSLTTMLRSLRLYSFAYKRIREHLQLRRSELEDQQITELEIMAQEFRRLYSRVSISSSPSGALVFIDGSRLGLTPLARMSLNHGNYRIEARLEGYKDHETNLVVPGGQPVDLHLKMLALGSDPVSSQRQSLRVGLWTSAGLFVASALMTIVSSVIAWTGNMSIENSENYWQSDTDSVLAWRNASYGLLGASAATGASSLLFFLLNRSGDNDEGL